MITEQIPRSSDVLFDILDSKGNPRLNKARDLFLPLKSERIEELLDVFPLWRDHSEYMLLEGENSESGERCWIGVKASKRGNDVFARRLDRKLGFMERLAKTRMFSVTDFKPNKKVLTNLLWITLTWDSKLCSLDQAWKESYGELHKFKANLEYYYGKIEWLVFPQPFPDQKGEAFGYPHFHGVLLFKEAQFSVFPTLEKDDDGREVLRYRIQEKYELESKGKWHSFVDVQALSSMGAVANYCKKYAENVCYGESEKAKINGAILWLYRKKTFSMTREFQKSLADLIVLLQNRKKVFMETLDGKRFPLWKWKFLGMFSARDLGVDPQIWVLEISSDQAQELLRMPKGSTWEERWEMG